VYHCGLCNGRQPSPDPPEENLARDVLLCINPLVATEAAYSCNVDLDCSVKYLKFYMKNQFIYCINIIFIDSASSVKTV